MSVVIDFGGVEVIDALDMLQELRDHGFRLIRRRSNGLTTWASSSIREGDEEWVESCLQEQCDDSIRLIAITNEVVQGRTHATATGF